MFNTVHWEPVSTANKSRPQQTLPAGRKW